MNRRNFIKTLGGGVATSMVFSKTSYGQKILNKQKPNILFITTDQQHSRMLSCEGDLWMKTPNLDRLAASGTRYHKAYCNNPVCVPSRYSLVTGRMPHVFNGLEHNLKKNKNNRPKILDEILQTSMGHLFRKAGYETAYGGKLHVERLKVYTPKCEKRFGFNCVSSDKRMELAMAGANFIREKRDKPFLFWASFINPHDICTFPFMEYRNMDHPYIQSMHQKLNKLHEQFPDNSCEMPSNFEPTNNEGEWIARFRNGNLPDIGLNKAFGRYAGTEWNEEFWKEYRWAYRRYMEMVDKEIGVLLDALKKSGQEENTLIIFTSDHGDHDGAHRLTMKRSFYEESVCVPFIMSQPGRVKSGEENEDQLISLGGDILATMCAVAGVSMPSDVKGYSLLEEHNRPEYVVSETVTGRMIRTRRYKYNLYYVDNKASEQLFDIDKDRGEMENLAHEPGYADILKRHRNILRKWVVENQDNKGQKYVASLKEG